MHNLTWACVGLAVGRLAKTVMQGGRTRGTRAIVAIALSLALPFIGLNGTASAQSQRGINVYINGGLESFDVPPTMIQGRVLVPLRGVFEQLGATVNYDAQSQQIVAIRGAQTVQLTIGSRQAFVNRHPSLLDVPAFTIGGRTMVPLRFVSESLGANVQWLDASQTILIGTGTAQLPYIQGTVDAVDCQAQTMVIGTPRGPETLRVSDNAFTNVDEANLPFCSLGGYVSAPATVWFATGDRQRVATEIDVTGPVATTPASRRGRVAPSHLGCRPGHRRRCGTALPGDPRTGREHLSVSVLRRILPALLQPRISAVYGQLSRVSTGRLGRSHDHGRGAGNGDGGRQPRTSSPVTPRVTFTGTHITDRTVNIITGQHISRTRQGIRPHTRRLRCVRET